MESLKENLLLIEDQQQYQERLIQLINEGPLFQHIEYEAVKRYPTNGLIFTKKIKPNRNKPNSDNIKGKVINYRDYWEKNIKYRDFWERNFQKLTQILTGEDLQAIHINIQSRQEKAANNKFYQDVKEFNEVLIEQKPLMEFKQVENDLEKNLLNIKRPLRKQQKQSLIQNYEGDLIQYINDKDIKKQRSEEKAANEKFQLDVIQEFNQMLIEQEPLMALKQVENDLEENLLPIKRPLRKQQKQSLKQYYREGLINIINEGPLFQHIEYEAVMRYSTPVNTGLKRIQIYQKEQYWERNFKKLTQILTGEDLQAIRNYLDTDIQWQSSEEKRANNQFYKDIKEFNEVLIEQKPLMEFKQVENDLEEKLLPIKRPLRKQQKQSQIQYQDGDLIQHINEDSLFQHIEYEAVMRYSTPVNTGLKRFQIYQKGQYWERNFKKLTQILTGEDLLAIRNYLDKDIQWQSYGEKSANEKFYKDVKEFNEVLIEQEPFMPMLQEPLMAFKQVENDLEEKLLPFNRPLRKRQKQSQMPSEKVS